jgi:Family of unknown function (DUF5643)
MNKNIYDMLNDSNIDLDELSKEGFNDIEKKKIKSSFKKSLNRNIDKKNNKKRAVIAVALAGILFVGFIGTDVGATVIDTIKMASYDIASFLGIKKDLAPYKTVINETLSNYELSIQLNEVILDGEELLVSSTVKVDDPNLNIESLNVLGNIYINGTAVSTSAGGVGSAGEVIDGSTFSNLIGYSLEERYFDGDLDVKIVYEYVSINGQHKKTEPIVFEFTTNVEELSKNTKEIELDNTFTLENGYELKLNKYTSNELSTKIYYSIDRKNKEEVPYYIELKGEDNEGNEITFGIKSGNHDGGVLKLYNIGSGISETATSIRLKPYAVLFPIESGMVDNKPIQIGEFLIQIDEAFTIQIN